MNISEQLKKELAYSDLPLGTIIAWYPRLFHKTIGNTVTPSNKVKLTDQWAKCDGRDLSLYDGTVPDSDYFSAPVHNTSPLIDGDYSCTPNLSDDRLLLGNFAIGTTPLGAGGNGNNTITVTVANLPPHMHGPGTINVPLSSGVLTNVESPAHTHIYGDGWSTWDSIAPGPYLSGAAGYDGGGASMNVYNVNRTSNSSPHQHPVVIPSSAFAGQTSDGGFVNNSINILPRHLKVIFLQKVL